MISSDKIVEFQRFIWDYYNQHKRDLPWRHTITPYRIVVSEVMLQQTQVNRTISKFHEFIQTFPDFASLASAELSSILRVWQGMGYSRRAKYLSLIAKTVVDQHGGKLPDNPVILDSFPGIGEATAASIVVYAFNKPVPFIETNVRRIFIHHFFPEKEDVVDNELFPFVEAAMDKENPRDWYYALMDYGTFLSKQVENPNRRSKHYAKQSKFEGSDRQIRGKILKKLLEKPLEEDKLFDYLSESIDRSKRIVEELEREGFVVRDGGKYRVK